MGGEGGVGGGRGKGEWVGEAFRLRLLFCKIVYRLYFSPDFAGLEEVVEF